MTRRGFDSDDVDVPRPNFDITESLRAQEEKRWADIAYQHGLEDIDRRERDEYSKLFEQRRQEDLNTGLGDEGRLKLQRDREDIARYESYESEKQRLWHSLYRDNR